MQKCPKLEEQPFDTFGDVVRANNYAMDMYEVCRLRHDKLIEYELKRK